MTLSERCDKVSHYCVAKGTKLTVAKEFCPVLRCKCCGCSLQSNRIIPKGLSSDINATVTATSSIIDWYQNSSSDRLSQSYITTNYHHGHRFMLKQYLSDREH